MPQRRPTRGLRTRRSGAGRAPVDAEIHYILDRLDEALLSGQADKTTAAMAQLWAVRSHAPGVLVQRLVSERARVPVFAFQLLAGFAGEQTPRYLRRIYADQRAADLTRWAARRRAPWPDSSESNARLAFLASLRDPDATLLQALAVANQSNPPDGEVLQELLAYLALLPPRRRQQFVELAIREADPS